METSTSLTVAALRCASPERLERLSLGLDVDAWGTLLAMLAAVIGPLMVSGPVSFGAFGIVVAGALSAAGVLVIRRAIARDRGLTVGDVLECVTVPLGSIAVIVPAQLLGYSVSSTVQVMIIGLLLAGVAVWFGGECHKLWDLEDVCAEVPESRIGQQVRSLRWGTYVTVLLVTIGLAMSLYTGTANGRGLAMACVALLVFSLMTTLLYSRISRAVRREAQYARAVIAESSLAQTRALPECARWQLLN